MNVFKLSSGKVVVLAILFTFVTLGVLKLAIEIPPKPSSGYVLDDASISEQEELSLNNQIQSLKDESSNEIGIFTPQPTLKVKILPNSLFKLVDLGELVPKNITTV